MVIGDKNFTEQFILGQLWYQALNALGYNITLTQNIGATSVTMQAIEGSAHTLDLYPEYLNVFLPDIAGQGRYFHHLRGAYNAAQRWANTNGLTLLRSTKFSDTEGLAVMTDYAYQTGLESLRDLRTEAKYMTIGAPLDFQTPPGGLPALEKDYGFRPGKVQTVDVGEQYAALSANDVQAAYINTTDGQLTNPDYTVLADPRHVLGFGNVVPVVRTATLEAEGSVFEDTINRIDRLLTTNVMRQLNAEVDLDLETPATVARQFLAEHELPGG